MINRLGKIKEKPLGGGIHPLPSVGPMVNKTKTMSRRLLEKQSIECQLFCNVAFYSISTPSLSPLISDPSPLIPAPLIWISDLVLLFPDPTPFILDLTPLIPDPTLSSFIPLCWYLIFPLSPQVPSISLRFPNMLSCNSCTKMSNLHLGVVHEPEGVNGTTLGDKEWRTFLESSLPLVKEYMWLHLSKCHLP